MTALGAASKSAELLTSFQLTGQQLCNKHHAILNMTCINYQDRILSSVPTTSIWYTSVMKLQVQLMGILNITPDSFSDGGQFFGRDAINRVSTTVKNMIVAGASIIDIGGESSRPGAEPVSVAEELQRVVPIFKKISVKTQNLASLSIDTYKPEVAAQAIKLGAKIINDISGLQNPAMRQIAARTKCKVVIMHMLGEPRNMQAQPHYKNVVQDIIAFFKKQIQLAVADGINRKNIIIDPGIGFGKTVEHNLIILRNLKKFKQAFPDLPLLIGASRKSFIGKLTGAEVQNRLPGTLALHLYAAQHGTDILRVHDVAEHQQALQLSFALTTS